MRLPKIVLFLFGGLCLPTAGYSQLSQLKIVDSEHFQYHVELKKLAANSKVNFSFNGSFMSVGIENATLGSVLQELSRVTGVDIYISEYRAQQAVSLAFENLPLERAMQRILGDNYTLAFNGLSGNAVSISDLANIHLIHSVEVAAKVGRGNKLQYSLEDLIEQSLLNGNEKELIFALEALKTNGGKIDAELLQRLMSEGSSKVRQLALKAAQREGGRSEDSIVELNDSKTTEDTHQPEQQNSQDSLEFRLLNGTDQERRDLLEEIRRNKNIEVNSDVLWRAAAFDSNPQNRKWAIDAISRHLNSSEAKDILGRLFQTEADPGVRQHIEFVSERMKKDDRWLKKSPV